MSRIIESGLRTGAMQLMSCVSSLLALELLHAGRQLYLSAPQLRNSLTLVNDMEQFSALLPEVDASIVTLAQTLSILAERGARVRVIYSSTDLGSDAFRAGLAPSAECRVASPLRNHGLVGEDYSLLGTLCFTDSGIDVGSDRVELSTEPETVSRALLEMARYWEELA